MNKKHGACPLCGAEKKAGTTTFTVDLGFGVVVVRRVPALVCSQCGDAWIENAIASRLEAVIDDSRRNRAVVQVLLWEHLAA